MDKFQNSIMMAGLFIMVVGFGLGMYAVLKELSSSLYFFVAGGCFAFVLILSLGLFLSVFIFTQEDKLNEVEIYKRVQATIDGLNTTFKPLGYEWKTTSRFLWLEFYKPGVIQMMPVPSGDNSPMAQPGAFPPNSQLQTPGFPGPNQLPNNIPQQQYPQAGAPPTQSIASSPLQPNAQPPVPNRAVAGPPPPAAVPRPQQQPAQPAYQQAPQPYQSQTQAPTPQQQPQPPQQPQQPNGALPGRKFGRS